MKYLFFQMALLAVQAALFFSGPNMIKAFFFGVTAALVYDAALSVIKDRIERTRR